MITFPQKLDAVITKILDQDPGKNWIKNAVLLSTKYRDRLNSSDNFISSYSDILAYLALRTPATYIQIYSALLSIQEINPNWKPKSVLDIGSGPGTSGWAVLEIWPNLKHITCLEKDPNFIKVGQEILKSYLPKPEIVNWQTADLNLSLPTISQNYDLVILGNFLNEVDKNTREKIIKFANKHCSGVLLIVEPGTPDGFEIIKQISPFLKSDFVIAPFIEKFLSDKSGWIHFSQKVKRPEFHRKVRQLQRKLENSKTLPPSDWEEVKYSYIATSKFKPEVLPFGRVIEKPKVFKGYIETNILTKDRVKTKKIFKREKEKYKFAKKLRWGDIITSPTDIL